MRPDLDPAAQQLVGTVEDAHARCAAVAREEQVVLLVDQDAGDAGQIGERAQERLRAAVNDVYAIGASVRHVDAAAGAIEIGVVETWRRAGRYRHEADVAQAHAAARPCATSCLHQA
jgi:GGDEF domain-containing protein